MTINDLIFIYLWKRKWINSCLTTKMNLVLFIEQKIWTKMRILMEEKVRTPYPLIASVAPFGWNNLSETLLVAIYQSLTSIWRKFAPLNAEFFSLRSVWRVSCMYSPFQVTPQHVNGIKVQALTWPLQNFMCLSFKPVLGGFAGMLWVIVMLHLIM